MPAIGRDRSRRALLCLGACIVSGVGRAANSADECWDVVAKMAAALGTGDPGEFLGVCDPGATGYETLRINVNALVAQVDVESAVDPIRNAGGDARREL